MVGAFTDAVARCTGIASSNAAPAAVAPATEALQQSVGLECCAASASSKNESWSTTEMEMPLAAASPCIELLPPRAPSPNQKAVNSSGDGLTSGGISNSRELTTSQDVEELGVPND